MAIHARAVGLSVFALCIACTGRQEARVDSAQSFVNEFYAWYINSTDKGGLDWSIEKLVKTRPSVFDSTLLAALREDIAASASNPGEIVGLDFDPITNSQDACKRYVADTAFERNSRVAVPVRAVCDSLPDRTPTVIVELVRRGAEWQIANLVYADSSSVLSILKSLRETRGAESVATNVNRALDSCSAPSPSKARVAPNAVPRLFGLFSLLVPDSSRVEVKEGNHVKLTWPGCEDCGFRVEVRTDSGISLDSVIATMIAAQRRIDSINKVPNTVHELDDIDGPPHPFTTRWARGYEIDYSCGDCGSIGLKYGRPGYIADVGFYGDAKTGLGNRLCEMEVIGKTFAWRR